MVKAKYNHGHHLLDIPHVVLGMYDPRKKQGYIQPVEKRDVEHVSNHPSECAHRDWDMVRRVACVQPFEWAWICLQDCKPFQELQGPSDCMNHVEDYWNAVNRRFKWMCSTTRAPVVAIWTDQFLWYFRQRFSRFLACPGTPPRCLSMTIYRWLVSVVSLVLCTPPSLLPCLQCTSLIMTA